MEESFGRYLALCRHERVGRYALEDAPAWVFSDDGRRILWANAAGLAFLDIRTLSGLARYRISETSPVSRRLAYLATRGTTGALERFRFFVGMRAKPVACLCERLYLPDNDKPVLAVAADAPAPSGESSAAAGLLRLLDQAGLAAALFDPDGDLSGTTSALAASGLPADALAEVGDRDGIDVLSGPADTGSLVLIEDPMAIDLDELTIEDSDESQAESEPAGDSAPDSLEPEDEAAQTAVNVPADLAGTEAFAEAEPEEDATADQAEPEPALAPEAAEDAVDEGAETESMDSEAEDIPDTSDEDGQAEDERPVEAAADIDEPSIDDASIADASDETDQTEDDDTGQADAASGTEDQPSEAEADTENPLKDDAVVSGAPDTADGIDETPAASEEETDTEDAVAEDAAGIGDAEPAVLQPERSLDARSATAFAAVGAALAAQTASTPPPSDTAADADNDTDDDRDRPVAEAEADTAEAKDSSEAGTAAEADEAEEAPVSHEPEAVTERIEDPADDPTAAAVASDDGSAQTDAAQADRSDADAAPGRKRTVFDAIERLAVPLMNLDLAKEPSRLAPKDDEPAEPDVEPGNGTVPEPPVEASPALSPTFVFRSRTAPHRFVWEMDENRRFSMITPDLADAVGPVSGNVTGKTWTEVAGTLGLDNPRIAATIERGETWTGMRVDWPVDGTDKIVPVELTALPIYDQSRTFAGYRGFGVCRTDRAQTDAQARGLALAQPLTASPASEADPIETAFGPSDGPDDTSGATPDGQRPDPAAFVTPVLSEQPGPDRDIEERTGSETETDDLAAPDTGPRETEEAQADLSWQNYLTAEALLRLFSETRTNADERARFEVLARTAGPDDDASGPDQDDGRPDGGPGGGSEGGPDRGPDAPSAETDTDREPTDSSEAPENGADPLTRTAGAEPDAEVHADAGPDRKPEADDDPQDEDSNVVPLVRSEGRDPNDKIHELSRPEREAFLQIAEALGARMEGEDEDSTPGSDKPTGPTIEVVEPDAPVVALPSAFAIGRRDVPEGVLLDRLPIGVLLCRGAEVLFGNRAALDVLEYRSVADLRAAGGLESVFTDGAAASSGDPDDEADRPITVRTRTGRTKSLVARLYSVPWANDRALMIVLDDKAPPATPATPTALPQDSRVAELESILDTATDGVLVMENDGTIRAANKSAEALFGADRVDMLGANLTDYLAPESHRSALDYIDGLARNGVESVLNDGREVIGRTTTGGLIPMFMTIGRIDRGAHSAKFCAVLRDITQWKKAEEDLTSARRQAETASSQKSDFLAKISHELRTPLNAIIGFSEVMLGERLGPIGTERYKEYLSDIRASGDYIMSLINDLLDLSKIEAGKMDLTFEAVAVNDVLHNCVALLQPEANRERIIIRTSLSTSVPNVVADARSLQQIVLNLLSNAIKFNKKGGQVIVSSAYTETGDVSVRVRDTGIGMSDEDLRLALEPFRQVQTTRPHTGGTGLGLPLTKALVEANRASFSIDSTPQEGTMVEITFPSPRVLAE